MGLPLSTLIKPWVTALLAAAAAGKTIQLKSADGVWVDIKPEDPYKFSDESRYRIKPEPIVRYVNVFAQELGTRATYATRAEAERAGKYEIGYVRTIKMVEEIES